VVSPDVLAATRRLIESERFGAVATVVSGDDIGSKAVIEAGVGVVAGSLPEALVDDVLADADELMHREQSRVVEYESANVFVEALAPPPVLVVFGAVHTAQALTTHASLLGFRVLVSDARPAFTTEERFPDADRVIRGWPEEVVADLSADRRTYVVLLSHDARFEDPVLEWAMRSEARYIGAMGSRRTHEKRVRKFAEKGFTDDEIGRIHGPVGLDIGAETPGETAISILAEMIQVRYGSGTGLSLRGREGRIHRQRTEDEGDV
jgi:xanthine dehydrogenase accessory factor